MAVARFKSETDRAAFVSSLLARGFRQVSADPPRRRLAPKLFRVYEYKQRPDLKAQLRVSYWEPMPGPKKKIPKAPAGRQPYARAKCATKGHETKAAYCHGLCKPCYSRWRYWMVAGYRAKHLKRLAERRAKRDQLREAA